MKTKQKRKVHPRVKRTRKIKFIARVKRTGYLLSTCFIVVFVLMLVSQQLRPQVYAQVDTPHGFVPEKILIENTQTTLDVLPINLSGSKEEKERYITTYLTMKGETDIARWIKIFNAESGLDQNSIAPTQWHKCDRAVSVKLWGYQQAANDIIELRDYPNGVWQATCEEFGAVTVSSGRSGGLSHIIEQTWDWLKCTGDRFNWTDNIDCSIKIRNSLGWKAWSTN